MDKLLTLTVILSQLAVLVGVLLQRVGNKQMIWRGLATNWMILSLFSITLISPRSAGAESSSTIVNDSLATATVAADSSEAMVSALSAQLPAKPFLHQVSDSAWLTSGGNGNMWQHSNSVILRWHKSQELAPPPSVGTGGGSRGCWQQCFASAGISPTSVAACVATCVTGAVIPCAICVGVGVTLAALCIALCAVYG